MPSMPMDYADFKKLVPTLTLEQLRNWWKLLHTGDDVFYVHLNHKEWNLARRMVQRRITTNLSGSVAPKEG